MAIDGIIFDLDGTLWDSCRVVAESWTQTMQQGCGSDRVFTVDDIKGVMGLTAADIAAKLFPNHGDDAMKLCLRCMDEELEYISEHSGDVYPGVEDMLSRLSQRWPLFIVSNCQDGYIQCFFGATGLGKYIKDIECEGATGLGKADNIKLICQRNGLENPVYVGDTAGDERSAKAAGCRFVHAAYGFGSVQAPDAVISSVAELPAALKLMEGENKHV